MTTDGWRDAVLLKKGGQLLLKGTGGDQTGAAGDSRTAAIIDVQTESKTLLVFNLEVANGHTYFVGRDGELAHNANSACIRKAWEKYYKKSWPKNPKTEKIRPGGNQDAHHKKYRSSGGSDHPRNIEPRTPSNHIRYHQKNGYK
jgi:hypothetical protein